MAIGTTHIKQSDFISKDLKPGNVVAKINAIKVKKSEKPKYEDRADWTITLDLEGKPVGGDFIGFDKEYGKPELGKLLGQSAQVKTSTWPIRTYNKKANNEEVTDVDQVLRFINSICYLFKNDWLQQVNGKFNTIEELVSGFNKETFYKSQWFNWCIGGTVTMNDAGYPKYYLYLPEFKVCQKPFTLEGDMSVTLFDESLHVYKNTSVTASADLANGSDLIDTDDDFDTEEDLFDLD